MAHFAHLRQLKEVFVYICHSSCSPWKGCLGHVWYSFVPPERIPLTSFRHRKIWRNLLDYRFSFSCPCLWALETCSPHHNSEGQGHSLKRVWFDLTLSCAQVGDACDCELCSCNGSVHVYQVKYVLMSAGSSPIHLFLAFLPHNWYTNLQSGNWILQRISRISNYMIVSVKSSWTLWAGSRFIQVRSPARTQASQIMPPHLATQMTFASLHFAIICGVLRLLCWALNVNSYFLLCRLV